MENWLIINQEQIFGIILSSFLCYLGLIFLVRLNGLRSFSKISGHDFAITLAIGSVFATTIISDSPTILQGILAISLLLFWKKIFSILRIKGLDTKLDNCPILVMREGEIFEDALRGANFTKADLFGKLREANVLNLSQVRAVIIEATGDVSVLHGDKDNFNEEVLNGIS